MKSEELHQCHFAAESSSGK